MIYYKDMTFCISENCKNECGRKLTEEIKRDAERWWGSKDAPISMSHFCDENGKKIVGENHNLHQSSSSKADCPKTLDKGRPDRAKDKAPIKSGFHTQSNQDKPSESEDISNQSLFSGSGDAQKEVCSCPKTEKYAFDRWCLVHNKLWNNGWKSKKNFTRSGK